MSNDASMMTVQEVADFFKVSKASVRRWVAVGFFPRPLRLSPGTIRFRKADIDRFAAEDNWPNRGGFWEFEQPEIAPEQLAGADEIVNEDNADAPAGE
jgi:predicted DNA-binding transcriptional regulator AlpA